MIDNLLSRIIELRAALTDSEPAAIDLQMHCVRSLMVKHQRRKTPTHICFLLRRNSMNDLVIYQCTSNIFINCMK